MTISLELKIISNVIIKEERRKNAMVELKYDRQSRIPHWDQDKLSEASVAVIGAGALGNHVCLGLIGLGVGTIKIYNSDIP